MELLEEVPDGMKRAKADLQSRPRAARRIRRYAKKKPGKGEGRGMVMSLEEKDTVIVALRDCIIRRSITDMYILEARFQKMNGKMIGKPSLAGLLTLALSD